MQVPCPSCKYENVVCIASTAHPLFICRCSRCGNMVEYRIGDGNGRVSVVAAKPRYYRSVKQ